MGKYTLPAGQDEKVATQKHGNGGAARRGVREKGMETRLVISLVFMYT